MSVRTPRRVGMCVRKQRRRTCVGEPPILVRRDEGDFEGERNMTYQQGGAQQAAQPQSPQGAGIVQEDEDSGRHHQAPQSPRVEELADPLVPANDPDPEAADRFVQDVRKEDALIFGSVGKRLYKTVSTMTSREFKRRAKKKPNKAKELAKAGHALGNLDFQSFLTEVIPTMTEKSQAGLKTDLELLEKESEGRSRPCSRECQSCGNVVCRVCLQSCRKVSAPLRLYCSGCDTCFHANAIVYVSDDGKDVRCPKCFEDVTGDTAASTIYHKVYARFDSTESWYQCDDCSHRTSGGADSWVHQACLGYTPQETAGQPTQCPTGVRTSRTPCVANAAFRASTVASSSDSSYIQHYLRSKFASVNEGSVGETLFVTLAASVEDVEHVPNDVREMFRTQVSTANGVENRDMPEVARFSRQTFLVWQNQGDFDMLLLMMYWDKYEANPARYHSNTTRLEMVDTVSFLKGSYRKTELNRWAISAGIACSLSNGAEQVVLWSSPANSRYLFDHPRHQELPVQGRLDGFYHTTGSDFVEADAERGFQGSSVTVLLSDGENMSPQAWQLIEGKIPVPAHVPANFLLSVCRDVDLPRPAFSREGERDVDELPQKRVRTEKRWHDEERPDSSPEQELQATKEMLFKKYRTKAKHVFVFTRAEGGQQFVGAASAVARVADAAAGDGAERTLPKTLVSSCPIFHGRDSFLETARAMGLQFSSRRLARHASRCLLLAILRPQEGIRALLPTCTKCTSGRKEDENGYRGVPIAGVRCHCASCGENWCQSCVATTEEEGRAEGACTVVWIPCPNCCTCGANVCNCKKRLTPFPTTRVLPTQE